MKWNIILTRESSAISHKIDTDLYTNQYPSQIDNYPYVASGGDKFRHHYLSNQQLRGSDPPTNPSVSFYTTCPPELTEDQLRLFNRARKFLRLEPWLSEVAILSLDKEHPDPLLEKAKQGDFDEDEIEPDFEDAVRERLEEKEGEAWPQLLNLVSSISRDKSGMRQEEKEAL